MPGQNCSFSLILLHATSSTQHLLYGPPHSASNTILCSCCCCCCLTAAPHPQPPCELQGPARLLRAPPGCAPPAPQCARAPIAGQSAGPGSPCDGMYDAGCLHDSSTQAHGVSDVKRCRSGGQECSRVKKKIKTTAFQDKQHGIICSHSTCPRSHGSSHYAPLLSTEMRGQP